MQQKNIIITVIATLLLSILILWVIIKKRTIRSAIPEMIIIGTNAEYPPFTFIKDEKIVGFDIDVTKEIFKRLNKKFEIKDMKWSALVPSLQIGNIQVIAAGMTATPERAKRVLFTKPYLVGDPLLIVSLAKNPSFANVKDLIGKTVIVNDGYTADRYMSQIKGPILQRLPSPIQGFLALQSGRADAYVIAKSAAQPFFEKYGEQTFNTTIIPEAVEKYSLAISKQYPKLLEKIQEALNTMKKDGTLQKLKNKWNIQ